MQVAFFHSLRFRLIASVVAIEVVMLSIMVWNNVHTIYKTHTDRLSDTASSLLQQFARTAGNYMVEVDYAGLEEYANAILGHSEVAYVLIYTPSGKRVMSLGEQVPIETPALDLHPTEVVDNIYDTATDLNLAGRKMGHVFMGFSLSVMQDAINAARTRSIVIAATEIVLSVIVTIVLGVNLTRRLKTLADAASDVGAGNYNIVLPVKKQDEVGLTANAFNKMVNDIADRTRRLQESQEQIRLLLDSTEEGIYGVDLHGICTFVNPSCIKILGYREASDLVGKNIHELIHHTLPDGQHYPKEKCKVRLATLAAQPGYANDEVHWRADGSSFPVEYWSHPIRKQGQVVGAVVTFFDITQRKQAEVEINQHRQHLQQLVNERTAELSQKAVIIDQIHDSVVTTDLDGVITSWNKGAERLFGYSEQEAIGRFIGFIYPEDELAFLEHDIVAPLLKEGGHEVEVRLRNKQGRDFYAHLSLSLLHDEQNNVIGMVSYSLDITARKQAEMMLQQRSAELAAVNKELEAFSYSVSHDLRAPLRAIDGFSHALREDYLSLLDDTACDYLYRIINASHRMGDLIDDLLKLARVTREAINSEIVDLSTLAKQALQNLQLRDPDREVEAIVTPHLTAIGDRGLLRVVVENLLDNAWKYSREQHPARIEFGVLERNGSKEFYVRDNGTGFEPQFSERIFGAFQRLHRPDEFEGTGIGLATVQRIIHRHAGEIRAESEPGKGATFFFTLHTNN